MSGPKRSWVQRINSHDAISHDSIDNLGHDWSRVAGAPGGSPPLRVYLPRSTADVVTCVHEAKSLGLPMTVRANGHSSNGLVVAEGGTLLLTRYLNQVLAVDAEALTITVQPGATNAEVDEHLGGLGLGLRVIGDHAHVTVGGFVSVGGISASSFRHGLFVDTVESLEYVDAEGVVATCTRQSDPAQFDRLALGLGRYGVITAVTIGVERIDKQNTFWHNHRTLHRSLDSFLATATRLLARPPDDARFMRGLWIDAGAQGVGQFSLYRTTPASMPARARDAVAYGFLHGLGFVSGHLPGPVDRALKYVGVAGIVLSPRYASVKNAESFSDKILDSTVGDPTRYLVAIARERDVADVARRMLDVLRRYRTEHGCLKVITLYLKGIRSGYLARGREGDDRWAEVLFLVTIDPAHMTPALLDAMAADLDEVCVATGSFRYMHSHTSRDPALVARIDPNAAGGERPPWPPDVLDG